MRKKLTKKEFIKNLIKKVPYQFFEEDLIKVLNQAWAEGYKRGKGTGVFSPFVK